MGKSSVINAKIIFHDVDARKHDNFLRLNNLCKYQKYRVINE